MQFKDEASKFEDEKSLLMAEYSEKLVQRAAQLVALMQELGVEIEDSGAQEDADDGFGALLQACKVAFQNYHENKAALQQLIDEREDIAHEKEDMGFELERANAELNFLKNQFAKSDVGKLQQQVATLTEEGQEMKNDFVIKFASYTEEIDTLKSRLSAYESQDESRDDQQPAQQDPADRRAQATESAAKPDAMETSREYRAKYNLEETVVEESRDPNQEAVAA